MNKASTTLLIKQVGALFIFLIFISIRGLAQSEESTLYIKVKFDEHFASRVENATMQTSSLGYLQTGIFEIDSLSEVFHLKKMERVFPYNATFDARHRKYGLHQWYRLATDEMEFQAMSCASVFEKCGFVLEAEVPLKKSFNDGYERKAQAQYVEIQNTQTSAATDPRFDDQWHYENTGQSGGTSGADISLLDAWTVQSGSDEVVVAIIDGGVDTRHEDLAEAMWTNDAELNGITGVDDDGNGYVDDIYGYSFADKRGTVSADRHGTHVAGTVGAISKNGIGVAGVAGGDGTNEGVKLMSCEVFGLSRNDGFDEAFIYAADNGAVISQNSWGYTSPGVYEQSVLDAIDYFIDNAGFDANGNPIGPMQGGIVIFAAGNSNSSAQYYPGYYGPVVAVASTDDRDVRSGFSNYGSWVDIAAPGSDVLSTFPGNAYGTLSGTSMACPHVSGVVALMVAEFGKIGYSPREAREKLLQSTDNIDATNPGYIGRLGTGRTNAYLAVQSDTGIPPSKITDFSSTAVTETSATLTWTATGRNGDDGKAHAYEVRYSTDTILASTFDAAELYFQSIVPKASGETESFVVEGLLPETKYFFALKARNYFGNTSEISNVATFTTADAPILSVQPDSLVISLDEGDSIIVNIVINNRGKEILNFTFPDFPSGTSTQSFVTEVSPNSGSIGPGASQNVSLKFEAGTSTPSNYFDQIRISSNDLVNPDFNIQALMHINGLPEITFSADTLDFGSLFNFDADSAQLVLSNTGNDTLNISQVDITGDFAFSPGFRGAPYFLLPGEASNYQVLFNPTTIGAKTGQIKISSNDQDHPDSTIVIQGQSIEGPILAISPDSIGQALIIPDSVVRNLQVQNSGGSDLIFSVNIASPDRSYQLSGRHMSGFTLDGVKTDAQSISPVTFDLISLDGARITFIEQGYMGDFINDLRDRGAEVNVLFGFNEQVLSRTDILVLDDALTAFTTAEIELIHQWIEEGGNALLLGDNSSTESNENLILEGSGIELDALGNYFSETFTDIKEDPITKDVNSLYAGAYGGQFILTGGARPLVNTGDGNVFSAAGNLGLGYIVAVGDEGIFSGEYPRVSNRLFGNQIIDYLYNQNVGSWLELNVQEDTLAAGASLNVEVSMNSKRLIAGTYESVLNFRSNDPLNKTDQIPVVFELTGIPELVASDTILDFGKIFIDQSDSLTLTVSNEGTDELNVSNVLADVSYFSVDSTTFSLDPGESIGLKVYYEPTDVAHKAGVLTFSSNDATGTFNLEVKGDPYEPPVLGSLSDTVSVTLNYGDSTTQALNIVNQAVNGAADLEFDLGIQINTASVTNTGIYNDAIASLNLAESKYAEKRLIVKFQPGLSNQNQVALREELGAEVLKTYSRTGIELWSVEDMTVEEAVGAYGDDPRLLYIEPDFIVETIGEPNDSRFDDLWGMHNTGQTGGKDDADIDALEAWDITTGKDNIVVGIIDTGIDYDHEDLRDNMWKNPGEIPDNGIDDDGNGYIDDVYGWDFANDDNDPFDGHSHGTHVAGTVGASGNNGIGVAGVSWNTQLMALKFLSDFGSGNTSDAIEAVEYAVNNGAHLTNNSWGGGSFSQALKDAITEAHQANQLFVAAAGNSRSNNDTRPMYPASYDVDNIISVAATDHNDELASFSSYGLQTVDLGAPGVSVLSSVPNNGYSSFNGTSMASPHVAGAIALTWSQAPFLSGMQMKAIVMEQVDPIADLANITVTGGRLNVLNMVQNTIGWIATDIRSGVINPGASEQVTISFNASGTYGGTYLADLVVNTNDPANNESKVILKMTVNGIPEIEVSTDSIGFGEQFINTKATQSVAIINDGTDLLEVSSITFDNPDFTSDSTSVSVNPGERQVIQITYEPTVDEEDEARMTLVSNDTARSSLLVKLTGTGILPPVIEVSPDSVGVALLSGDSTTQVLSIENTGSSDLIFDLDIAKVSRSRAQFLLPAGTIDPVSLDGEMPAKANFAATPLELADLTGVRISFIDQGYLGSLKADLNARGAVVQTYYNFQASLLDNTDVLILDDALVRFPSTALQIIRNWIKDGGNILLLGDNSSTEAAQNQILSGSGITLNTFGYFKSEQFTDIVTHEINQRVSQLYASAFGGKLTLSGGAQPLVRTATGDVFAGITTLGFGEVVVVADEGIFGHSLYAANNRTFGNQILDYLSGTSNRWLSIASEGDTIIAGSKLDIDLDLNATGLYTGLYEASITIASNDPVTSTVQIPVAIDVTGVSAINLPIAEIDFGTPFTGTTVTDTLLIQNTGTDTLKISSVSVDNLDFSLSATTLALPPETEQEIGISYSPILAESDDAVLTINSNDPDNSESTIDFIATGLAPPVIAIDPDSVGVALLAGDSSQTLLKIENTGVSDLMFDLNLHHQSVSRATFEFLAGQEDADTTQAAAAGPKLVKMELLDLTGFNVIFLGYNYANASIISDLTSRGAIVNAYSNFEASILKEADVLVIDDKVRYFSSASLSSIRDWVREGGSLLVMAQYNAQYAVNTILTGSDIRVSGYRSHYGTFVNFGEHNTTEGITRLYAPYGSSDYLLTGQAKPLIYGNSGTIFAASADFEAGHVIALGNDDLIGSRISSYDNRQFSNQVIDYLAFKTINWIDFDVESDTLTSSEVANVPLRFNAKGLNAGDLKVYLSVSSNDPVSSEKIIPVTLSVSGSPEIALSDSELDYGITYVGTVSMDTLHIQNVGTDTLKVTSLTVTNTDFTLSESSLEIPPGLGQDLVISYSPLDDEVDDTILTITNNDADNGSIQVDLKGLAIDPPELSINPDSVGVTLFSGDSVVQTLTVQNTGATDLIYNYKVQRKQLSPTSFEFLSGKMEDVNAEGDTTTVSEASLVSMELANLTGFKISFMGYSYGFSSFISTMRTRGAEVMTYYGVDEEALEETDVLILNQQRMSGFTANDTQAINEWVKSGGSLLVMANNYVQHKVNDILSGGNIQSDGSVYFYGTYTDIRPHEVTEGVNSLYFPYRTASYNLSGSAEALVVHSSGSVHAATTSLGKGHVVAIGNDDLLDYRISYADNRLFGNQVIDYLVLSASRWVSVETASDTLSAGNSMDIDLKFNADGLNASFLEADLIFSSNDPFNAVEEIPLSLMVTGAPTISLSDSILNFGSIFTGTTIQRMLTFSNVGTDTLKITNITADDPAYSISKTSLDLPPDADQTLVLTYAPTVAANDDATLTIYSNDPTDSELEVDLNGSGVSPPVVEVGSDSLGVALFAGDSTDLSLQIQNTGLSDLYFEMNIRRKSNSTSSFEFMAGQEFDSDTEVTTNAVPTKMELGDLTGYSVAIVGYYYSSNALMTDLTSRGAEVRRYSNFSSSILDQNDVLILDNNVRYNNTATLTSIRNWVLSGGRLLLLTESTAQVNVNYLLSGSGIELKSSAYNYGTFTNLAAHETTEGVTTLYAPYGAASYTITGLALPLVYDGSGDVYAATSELGAGQILVMGNEDLMYNRFSYYDNRLFGNQVIDYLTLSGNQWVTVDDTPDTLSAGGAKIVKLAFNAKELNAGIYEAELEVASNDPVNPKLSVPLSLTVSGEPDIEVSAQTIDLGSHFLTTTYVDTLQIQNTGTDTLNISDITINNTDFTVNSTTATLPPDFGAEILITYIPVVAEVDDAILSIFSDDPANPETKVNLEATGVSPPIISINPDSLGVTLFSGDSVMQSLNVINSGLSELTFTVDLQAKSISTSAFEFMAGEIPADEGSGASGTLVRNALPTKMELQDLTGVSISFVGYNYSLSNIISDLQNRGGLVSTYYSFNESILDDTDVLIIDDRVRYFPSSAWEIIRKWVRAGRSLLIHASSSSQTQVNEILQGSNIQMNGYRYNYGTFTTIGTHETTSDVSTLYAPYGGSAFALTGSAKALITTSSNDVFSAVTKFGNGTVVVLGNDDLIGRRIASYDNRLFANQLFDFLSRAAYRWLSVIAPGDTVAANATEPYQLKLNATGLNAGLYEAQLSFKSNDPVTPETILPVSLTVNGKPEIELSVTSIDFGTPYTGTTVTDTVFISNPGTDTLKINSMSANNTDYTLSSGTATILPGEDYELQVTYAPIVSEVDNATLTINSNDATNAQKTLNLVGTGLAPPVIDFSPDSLGVALNSGDDTNRTLTVKNTGGSDLIYDIQIQRRSNTSASFEFLAGQVPDEHMGGEAASGGTMVSMNLDDLTGFRISFVGYHYSISSFISDLTTRGAEVSRYSNFTESILDQTDVLIFDHRMRYTSTTSLNAIREWIKEGGTALLTVDYSSQSAFNTILSGSGIYMSNSIYNYGTFTKISAHETTEGVSSLYAPYSSAEFMLTGNMAKKLIENNTGDIFGAVTDFGRGKVIVLGNDDLLGSRISYYNNRLFGNQVIDYLTGTIYRWLSVSHESDTISLNSSLDLQVDFNAEGLNSGIYEAELSFRSNDPITPVGTVPVSVTVTGRPTISFDTETINFGNHFTGTSSTDTLHIRNDGTDTLKVTDMVVSNTDYTTDIRTITLPPGQSSSVIVTYKPLVHESDHATLTVHSNDLTRAQSVISLKGMGLDPPAISLNPDSTGVEVVPGDKVARFVKVENTGNSDLIYSLRVGRSPNSVSTFEFAAGEVVNDELSSPIRAELANLSGVKVTFVEYGNMGILRTDLRSRGAVVNRYTSISSSILNQTDVLVVDERMRFFSTQQNEEIRQWVADGGNLLVLGDYNMQAPVNFILSGSDLQMGYSTRNYSTFTDIVTHPTTEDVSTLHTSSSIRTLTVTGDAESLVKTNSGDVFAATTRLGLGEVVVIGNDDIFGGWVSYYENKLFGNQIIDYLAFSPEDWLSTSIQSDTLSAGSSRDIELSFDASGLKVEDYEGAIAYYSNDPTTPEKLMKVTMSVIDGANADFSAANLDFGDQFVGTVITKTIDVINSGSEPLIVTSVDIDNSDYAVDASNFTLAAGQRRTLTVTYSPTAKGPDNAVISLNSNDASTSTPTVNLSANASQPPVIVANPVYISADIHEGENYQQQLNIKNTGESDLDWSVATGGIIITYDGSRQASGTIAPGSETTISVVIDVAHLTAGYAFGSDINIYSNDPVTPHVHIPIRLRILPRPELTLSSTSLDFGQVQKSATSTQKVTIINDGSEDLQISGLSVTEGFTTTTPAEMILSPGDSSEVEISFEALTIGDFSGSLTFETNDPGNPEVDVTLSSSVFGIADFYIEQDTIDLGAFEFDESREFSFSIENLGDVNLDVSNVSVSNQLFSIEYSVFSMMPGEVAVFAVSLTEFNSGQYTDVLTFTSNDPDEPEKSIVLIAERLAPPVISLSSTDVDFGKHFNSASDSLTLMVYNTGGGLLGISEIASDHSNFTISESEMNIEPGDSSELTVYFISNEIAQHEGMLTFHSNDPVQSSYAIDLSGSVLMPSVTATDSEIDFGAVYEQRSVTYDFHIQNDGAGLMNILSMSTDHDFFAASSAATHIASGASLAVTVTFSPTNEGSFESDLIIETDALDQSVITLKLIGTGQMAIPLLIQDLDNMSINAGVPENLDLNHYFSDPLGEQLIYSFSYDGSLFNTSLTNGLLEITGLMPGSGAIEITASNAVRSLTKSFSVVVENAVPELLQEIEDQELLLREVLSLDLNEIFTDANDVLNYSITENPAYDANVGSDLMLRITAMSVATAEVTLTATDPYGASVSTTFTIRIKETETDLTLGISPSEIEVYVYPNPSNGTLYLSDHFNVNDLIKLEVFNLSGTRIEFEFDVSDRKLSIESAEEGVYFVKLLFPDQRVVVKKFYIQH